MQGVSSKTLPKFIGGPFPIYGIFGLAVIFLAEVLMFGGVEPVATWFTPIVWTGYIFFADALVLKRRGRSLIHDRPREFLMIIPVSVGLWLTFEAYNLHLKNWHYIGVPEPPWRYIGFFWSFATILPGILETSDLVAAFWPFRPSPTGKGKISIVGMWTMFGLGLLLLTVPLLLPSEIARYLFALVWLGFIFLLEPLNYRLGNESLFAQWLCGDYRRTINLLVAGLLCGMLWEFWNFWAQGKWIYNVPWISEIKIFEMPVLGFLGFPPFALEEYSMYQFLKHWLNRWGASI